MKLFALLSAGVAIAAAALTPTAASADRHVRVVQTSRVVHYDGPRRDRWRTRTVCEKRWRNGHRVRVCRQVRSRR